MRIKKYDLVFDFAAGFLIALLYGVAPDWFARSFLDALLDPVLAHFLRAVMGFYLALGLVWLYAAFQGLAQRRHSNDDYLLRQPCLGTAHQPRDRGATGPSAAALCAHGASARAARAMGFETPRLSSHNQLRTLDA